MLFLFLHTHTTECCSQVHKFKSAKFKKFKTKDEAERFILENKSNSKLDAKSTINAVTKKSQLNNQPLTNLTLAKSTQFPSITSLASTIRSTCSRESVLFDKVVKKSTNLFTRNTQINDTIVLSDDEKSPNKPSTSRAFSAENEDSVILLEDDSPQQSVGVRRNNRNVKSNKTPVNRSNAIRTSLRQAGSVSETNKNLGDFVPINNGKPTSNNNDEHDENKSKNIQLRNKGHVVVYTDGACSHNGYLNAKAGIGVWWGKNDPRNLSEPLEGRPTNNRAEIWAAIKAINRAAEEGYDSITVCSDRLVTTNFK